MIKRTYARGLPVPLRLSWEEEVEQLLPGEDVTAITPRQIRRWVAVYTELVAAKRRLIAKSRELMRDQSDVAQLELNVHWMPMLQFALEHFERRLGFWQSQRQSKEGE